MPMKSLIRTSLTYFTSLLLVCLTVDGWAQIGGLDTYQFLNLSPSARTTALGGHTIAIQDDDVTLGLLNPAALSDTTHQRVTLNHNFHIAGISNGYLAYGHHLKQLGINTSIGVQYVDYGQFVRADVFGNRDGSFNGSEVAVVIGASKAIDERLTGGINLKVISSNFDGFGSFGLGADLGLQYRNKEKRSVWALSLRNVGGQLSTDGPKRQSMPVDLLIGYSKRLEHLPFRWMITMHDIQRWDLSFDSEFNNDPIIIGQSPAATDDSPNAVDNFFRHLTFGGELLIGPREGFAIRLGYDHQRKKELAISGFRSLSGLSLGFGFKVKRFQIDYGIGRQHLAGGLNHLSVRVNLAKSTTL